MGAYNELQQRVADETLSVVNIVGVPRSMSTAFARSLNETDRPSVYVNEPLNRNNADTETMARFLLEASADIPSEPASSNTLIITKNMASYMTDAAFHDLEAVSSATVWTIRDPMVQIGSLLTRIVNDLYAGPGSDTIPQADIAPYLAGACDFLMDSPKSRDFSKTGWQAIGGHHESQPQATRTSLDGTDFAANPAESLSTVCAAVGLAYSPAMVSGWKNDFINVVNRDQPDETSRSAWTGPAATSVGVQAVRREALDFDALPESLQDHISHVAIPVYERIRFSP